MSSALHAQVAQRRNDVTIFKYIIMIFHSDKKLCLDEEGLLAEVAQRRNVQVVADADDRAL